MTKKELEIKCKVLEERLEKINELCEKYSYKSNAAEIIGGIEFWCSQEDIERAIDHAIRMSK